MNNNLKAVLILFPFIVNNIVSESTEESSLEANDKDDPGAYLVSVDNDYKGQSGNLFNYFKLNANDFAKDEDEQMLQTVEVTVPDDEDDANHPVFRAKVYYAREFAKKREFLQCKSEEPIVHLCHKSCHNVFKTLCFDFRCPPRLIIATNKECYENCRKSYKNLRGQKYIPPEKY